MAKIKVGDSAKDFYTVTEYKRLKDFCKFYREYTRDEGKEHEDFLVLRALSFCVTGNPDAYISARILGEVTATAEKNRYMDYNYYDCDFGGIDALLEAWVSYTDYGDLVTDDTKYKIARIICLRSNIEQETYNPQTCYILESYTKD